MQTEKTSLRSINLPYIPGGTTIYDSKGQSQLLPKPTARENLLEEGITDISLPMLEKQGVQILDSRIKFVYPEKQQSLVSFVGVLPSYTLVFTNPSEDPKNHSKELTNEVYITQEDIEFTPTEPATFSAIRVIDSTPQTLSRLGHMISLFNRIQPKSIFPPSDLRLYLPPVHIASQHAGECGADALQTILFFSDFFVDVFANVANEIYKKYISIDKTVIFNVDDPRLVEEIRKYFGVVAVDQKEEDALFVFASMVRRFILIRLLDFGTQEEIATLNIPPTTCLLPSAVPTLVSPQKRRKSINRLAGITIARRISRIFDPKSMFTAEKKLMGTELNLMIEHSLYCLFFKLFHQPQFKSIIYENHRGPPCDLSQITAILFSANQTKKDRNYRGVEGEGHAISMFRNSDIWYFQDDNIGIAQPMKNFNFEHYMTSPGEVFFRSYEQLPNKSQLIEQGYFTEDQLRKGKARRYTFYGYDYMDKASGNIKQKIFYATDATEYMSEYMTGPVKLMLIHGDISPEKNKHAVLSCIPKEEPKPTVAPKEPKLKPISSSILVQLNTNYKQATVRPTAAPLVVQTLRKNIQNQMNSFTTNTRKNIRGNTTNLSTRKVRMSNNAGIRQQFESF